MLNSSIRMPARLSPELALYLQELYIPRTPTSDIDDVLSDQDKCVLLASADDVCSITAIASDPNMEERLEKLRNFKRCFPVVAESEDRLVIAPATMVGYGLSPPAGALPANYFISLKLSAWPEN